VFNTDAKVIVLNIGMGAVKPHRPLNIYQSKNHYYGLLRTKLLVIDTHTRICKSEKYEVGKA
jgi:hypothetical protein